MPKRPAHTFTPNTADPKVCTHHDVSCSKPACRIATRMVPEGITKAVRLATYAQYKADKAVDFDPRRYGERPAPTIQRIIKSALTEHDTETRSYKGERQTDTTLRAAFMKAMGGKA